ncbi:neuronal growth regulator 1 [Halyomorpha halys]|uniref:neuronal growth regulator 1 n=1 Tax=Halyomorpha halys TaxID=286706 RepID=UPI0006D5155E
MWPAVPKRIVLALVLLTISVEREQAANVGGGGQNELQTQTTAAPSTTPRGLAVSNGKSNFTVQSGTKFTLHCNYQPHDENTSVSWMRRMGDSLQLISVNTEVYSPDPRYRISFTKPGDWQLHVQSVNFTDKGYYECQVNSHPPIVYSVYVHVVVPELEIKDERDIPIKNKFYNSGSTIELRCLIVRVPQPTQFILWRHNSTILNYDTTRGGISVKTDILPDGAKSQLYIANVGPTDSGNYSCSLGEDTMTWISVVVITGETPAAMQHGCAATAANLGLLTLLSAVLSALS